MRQQFITIEALEGKYVDRFTVAKDCPWAERIVKVEGGYMCFESETDYKTWKRQK